MNAIAEEVTNDIEVTETKGRAPAVVNMVTLEDGSTANFGARAKVITSYDVDTMTLTFKVITGEIINWAVENANNMTDFQKQVFLFGLYKKIKGVVAAIKDETTITESLNKVIESLKSEKFSTRTTDGEVSLDNLQKAWATVKSGKYPQTVADPIPAWASVNEPAIIAEVLAAWQGLTKELKLAVRRNPFVIAEKAMLDQTESDVTLL